MSQLNFDKFTRGYIDCALWSSSVGSEYATANGCADDTSLQNAGFSADDLSLETRAQIIEECARFQAQNVDALDCAGDPSQNGHDYWLTRNHHGTGFWDRGYPEPVSKALTDAAHADGERDLYVADDGLIYQA
ncbi:MAG: hypothetical protein ACP5P4_05300 [Steroidobacteraceae bacterium]